MVARAKGSVKSQASEASPTRPVLLFDGVCNLCNGAVQWLLERDHDGRLRFASLQSQAARWVLAEAGVDDASALPDSMVLVDAAGVHVRSTAALRVARLLGFPYNWATAGFVVPRFLRDAIYRWVARNRYRWFGRRDLCLRPTPELAARFLDADEPSPVVEEAESEAAKKDDSTERSIGGAAGLERLAIAYVVLYMLPFPFTLVSYFAQLPLIKSVPGVRILAGGAAGLYNLVMAPVVAFVGTRLFGADVSLTFTGSGDQTFNYVQLLVIAALAVVAGVAWHLAARGSTVSPRTRDACRVVARYYLGTTLLTYGWAKVFPLQFPPPGPDRLLQPYGDSSPMGLAWTFLGASAGYQIFSGLAELFGGYLLFFRRTTLLGAVVSLGVLTNVAAINYFYDVPVKLFSSHLLLIALFILAKDLPRLLALFISSLPIAARTDTPFWHASHKRALALGVARLVLLAAITTVHISGNLDRARSSGFLRTPSALSGVYRVTSFERGGQVDRQLDDAERWVRVGINAPFVATVQRATGDAVRLRLDLDEEAQTVSFYDRGAEAPQEAQFHYTTSEDGMLRLDGVFEGEETKVTLEKSEAGSLLLERGYHWINEYPFNR